jgi:hypothetical protein
MTFHFLGQDYVYETEVGEAEDVPIIIIHFGTVFAGTETSAVFIQGIFQYLTLMWSLQVEIPSGKWKLPPSAAMNKNEK